MSTGIETIARGDASRISLPQRAIARDEAEWGVLWAAHAGTESARPAVDFNRRFVAAVFAGERPSPGSGISIVGSRQERDGLVLLIEERRPAPGEVTAQVLVSPYHIVSLPRQHGEVRFADTRTFEAAVSRPDAAALASRRPQRRNPSSTGLEPQTAGALAYLAGPFSGALLLLIERTSHFVRFHAWQAVIGLGGLGLVAAGCLGLAFVLLVMSTTAFWVALWTAAILGWSWLALWAVCLVRAYRGNRWKIPLAGVYAERLSRR